MTRRKALTFSVLSALGVVAGAGCYERVVGARGYGASHVDVYEPNVPDTGGKTRTPMQRKPPTRMTPKPVN